MKKYKVLNKKGGCLIGMLISLSIFVVVIVGGTVTLINQTPKTLGVADVKFFKDVDLTELGLADVKIKDIFGQFKILSKSDTSQVVANPFDSNVETKKAEDNLGSALPKTPSGETDFTAILNKPIVFKKEYLTEYNDTTLAYIFNKIIAQTNSKSTTEEGFVFLKNINANIDEISITGSGKDFKLRVVLSINSNVISEQIKATLGAMSTFIKVPDVIYMVSYMAITADNDGKIVATGEGLKINDAESVLANAIFKMLSKIAFENGFENNDTDINIISGMLGNAFSGVIANLGKVGTATVGINNVVLVKNLGAQGITEHKLSIITNKAV
ncbi:MAG: hypothetical protein RR357_03095 [Clostridia bacterium]